MTSRPELATDANLGRGVGAVVLFVVLAAAFAVTHFGAASWFPAGISVTAGIGYALFDLGVQTPLVSHGFLAAFETIDIALVGALVGAVLLARKDDEEEDR